MIKIALLGESPGDSQAIKNLFKRYYHASFEPLLFNIHGSELDNPNNKLLKKLIRREFEERKPDLLIYIRDLDALEGNV